MKLDNGLTVRRWEDDLVETENDDDEKFSAYWDDETFTWSVTAFKDGNHDYLGEYHNLVTVLDAMALGSWAFYDLKDVRQ